MDYDLKIRDMRIQDMPDAWGLRDKKGNSFVQGVVAGWAKLKFLHDPVKGMQTSGSGLGLIEQAKLLGLNALQPKQDDKKDYKSFLDDLAKTVGDIKDREANAGAIEASSMPSANP